MVGLNLTKPYICTANYFEMKKFLIHLVIPFSVLLTSCGGDDKGSETSNDNAGETTQPATDFSGMQKVSLNDFQLEAEGLVPQIAGPNGDIIPYTVLHEEDDFFWVIEIGPEGEKFRLIIENAAGIVGESYRTGRSYTEADTCHSEDSGGFERSYSPNRFFYFSRAYRSWKDRARQGTRRIPV